MGFFRSDEELLAKALIQNNAKTVDRLMATKPAMNYELVLAKLAYRVGSINSGNIVNVKKIFPKASKEVLKTWLDGAIAQENVELLKIVLPCFVISKEFVDESVTTLIRSHQGASVLALLFARYTEPDLLTQYIEEADSSKVAICIAGGYKLRSTHFQQLEKNVSLQAHLEQVVKSAVSGKYFEELYDAGQYALCERLIHNSDSKEAAEVSYIVLSKAFKARNTNEQVQSFYENVRNAATATQADVWIAKALGEWNKDLLQDFIQQSMASDGFLATVILANCYARHHLISHEIFISIDFAKNGLKIIECAIQLGSDGLANVLQVVLPYMEKTIPATIAIRATQLMDASKVGDIAVVVNQLLNHTLAEEIPQVLPSLLQKMVGEKELFSTVKHALELAGENVPQIVVNELVESSGNNSDYQLACRDLVPFLPQKSLQKALVHFVSQVDKTAQVTLLRGVVEAIDTNMIVQVASHQHMVWGAALQRMAPEELVNIFAELLPQSSTETWLKEILILLPNESLRGKTILGFAAEKSDEVFRMVLNKYKPTENEFAEVFGRLQQFGFNSKLAIMGPHMPPTDIILLEQFVPYSGEEEGRPLAG